MQNPQQVRVALDKGANANAINKDDYDGPDFAGHSALSMAVYLGNREIVTLLIQAKANVNERDSYGRTLLMRLAYDGETEKIRLLRKFGADVHVRDLKGRRALDHASDYEVVRLLLDMGADIEARDNEGDTALLVSLGFEAEGSGAWARRTALIDLGADVNVRSTRTGITPLMQSKNTRFSIERLLRSGADVHARDHQGNTALHYAKSCGIIKLLIQSGADIEARNKNGETPIFCDDRQVACMKALLEHKANVNVHSKSDGQTPLIRATRRADLPVVELLSRAGADPKARDNNGNTALLYAERQLEVECERLLVDGNIHYSEARRCIDLMKIVDLLKAAEKGK